MARGEAERELESTLAETLLQRHPMRAAKALEQLGLAPVIEFLSGISQEQLARVVPLLSPQFAAEVLRALPSETVAGMLASLPRDVAARLARGLGERREDVIALLPEQSQASLGVLLRFPPDTAGGLMDPTVLALPDDLSAEDALDRIRELSANARYNLYVVDRQQHLVGVLNLRELFLAGPKTRLAALMVERPHALPATAGRASIITHPGWREAHALPVVDESGRYLGAIRYRTLRMLEDAFRSRGLQDEASGALGELLAVGAGGLVRALTSAPATDAEDGL